MDQHFKDWIEDCGGGQIERVIHSQPLVVWALRLLFIALGAWAFWHSQHADSATERSIDYLILVFAVWRAVHQGKIQAVLCGRGMVFRRKPLNLQEALKAQVDTELLYTFVEYRYILGFTPDFKSVTLMLANGTADNLVVMAIDFDFVTYVDKMKVLERISSSKEGTGT